MFFRLWRAPTLSLLAIAALGTVPQQALASHHEPHQAKHSASSHHDSGQHAAQHFIQSLNHTLQQHNQQLLKQRSRIQTIAQRYLHNDDISEADFNWLKNITNDYQLIPQQRGDQAYFQALLRRVDVVPPSLAIAQAIIETGWGEAASTAKANNPFGLQCGHHCRQHHRNLRQFPSQQAAVAYYVKLLNTAKAYEPFRQLRAQARLKNKKLRGEPLASGLIKYSTQGHRYISKIQETIKINQLEKLD